MDDLKPLAVFAEVVDAGAHPTLAIYRTTDGGAHWTRFGVPSLS